MITVFTATYNRAHLLYRVYDSLCAQSFHDFEWLIVDDGSTDNTADVITTWQTQSQFPIRYIWQEHGHKKKAFNLGVKEAKGELFLILDSDDSAVPETLETFYHYWLTIPQEKRSEFVGIMALCIDNYGKIVGDSFPHELFDSNMLEIYYRYRIRGDKTAFFRTDVLRKFPFPENVQEHVPENIVWFAIAKHYKMRCLNKPLYIVYYGNSITRGVRKPSQHCDGLLLWATTVLENDINWFSFRPLWFFKMAANHTRFALHLKDAQPKKTYPLQSWRAKTLKYLMWLFGYALYRLDRVCESAKQEFHSS